MARESIQKFVLERRRGWSAKQIADRFLCNVATVYAAVNPLLSQGKLIIEYKGRTRLYRGRHDDKDGMRRVYPVTGFSRHPLHQEQSTGGREHGTAGSSTGTGIGSGLGRERLQPQVPRE